MTEQRTGAIGGVTVDIPEAGIRITVEPLSPEPVTQIVNIPGTFDVTLVDGKIDRWTSCPHGSNAGYFGDAASQLDGPPIDLSDDGVFWQTVRRHLADHNPFPVNWEE